MKPWAIAAGCVAAALFPACGRTFTAKDPEVIKRAAQTFERHVESGSLRNTVVASPSCRATSEVRVLCTARVRTPYAPNELGTARKYFVNPRTGNLTPGTWGPG